MNVVEVLYVDGFGLETRVVDVGILLTCNTTLLVLVVWFESPEYAAVIECIPAESAFVENAATLLEVVPVPIVLPAS